jgi:hypothetical protein
MYVSVKRYQLNINRPCLGTGQLKLTEGIGGLSWPTRKTAGKSDLVLRLGFILFG